MKKLLYIGILVLVISTFSVGCGIKENKNPDNTNVDVDVELVTKEVVFEGKVVEAKDSLLVEPVEGSQELKSSDRIVVGLRDSKITNQEGSELTLDNVSVDNIVEITYDGMIAESYPAKIHANKVILLERQDKSLKAEPTAIFDKEVNNFDGVTMKLLEVTNTSISVELLNTTDQEIIYGSDYDLQQLLDGKWYSLSYLIDNWGFTSEGYTLVKDEPTNRDENWEVFHGSLEAGHYRYVKSILDFRATGDYTTYYLGAEFEIDE